MELQAVHGEDGRGPGEGAGSLVNVGTCLRNLHSLKGSIRVSKRYYKGSSKQGSVWGLGL